MKMKIALGIRIRMGMRMFGRGVWRRFVRKFEGFGRVYVGELGQDARLWFCLEVLMIWLGKLTNMDFAALSLRSI